MKRLTLTAILLFSVLLFTRCELILALAEVSGDNCERYSIYRSTIIGDDDLLWEETACDYDDREGLEERFNEQFAYYQDLYSNRYVYSEHVTYSQY